MSSAGRHSSFTRLGLGLIVSAAAGVAAGARSPQSAPVPAAQTAPRCRIEGRVTSGNDPLPGATVVVHVGAELKAATSTDLDGRYVILFGPNATYHISADLTAFTGAERDLTLAGAPCDTTVDFKLTLAPRRPAATVTTPAPARGNAAPAPAAPRFETLNVQTDANGAATVDTAAPADPAEVTRLLPPGFSAQTAQADAVAINGGGDATSLDRGAINDRFAAIGAGQFDPATGQFAGGGIGADGPGAGGPGPGGRGGPGGGQGARGGGPGRGGFVLGGRGARGQNPYQGTTTYTFGGSALDALPYQVRPDAPNSQPQFAQNSFGTTFGGPLRIPKVYADTNNRTNFQINYTGNRSNNLFDQYATVPTEAMRNGDFSASPIQLVDPANGQPFAGNQIPAGRIDPTAAALVGYIPLPNLPGTSQNYHVSTTSHTTSDNISLRVTQNLSPTVVPGGRGGPGGGRGGFGGGRGGAGGGRGGAGRGTNIMLNVQMQYRRNENEQLNVFPNLGGKTTNTSIATPISLNVSRGRSVHNFTVSITHSSAESTNAFSGVQNVASQAGINYPSVASTDPLNWGVPNLSFSGYTGLRGASANLRTDNRITTGYVWSHPVGTHQLRMGGDYRFDNSTSQSNSNPRGSFTFTGLYASGGSPVAGRTGADFADFLLGAPQQATLQVGDVTHLHGNSFDAYVEDNWQKNAKLTFNLGLRYELVRPYVEVSGQMANLDAAPGFTSVAPVEPGSVGPYTGVFPAGLLNTDINNIGPRVGVAYRVAPGTILRGGYSITYNPGSYAAIARQLVAQPPFAQTGTVAGTTAPLSLQNALLAFTGTTNNYGVDRDYALGTIQTWNSTLSRNLNPIWSIVVGYTGTKGTDLDVLSAPNRGPGGTLLIPGVEPFTWESSTGHSIMNAGNFQLVRRLAHGFSGSAAYTLAKAMDNSPSLGAGGTTVAQNNQDLASEWALSNFDRRQQFTGNLLVELPFGPNRRWLDSPGLLPTIVGGWSLTLAYTAQTGTPLTARVVGAASDVAQGTNGALRADYTGAPISEGDPTLSEFFNTSAFAVPQPGLFGDSSRNMIIGPGGNQLNGALIRDVPLGGNKGVTLQINAVNLLNTVQWQAIDTNVNSPTFGQVLAARPMRALTLTTRFRF